MQTVPLSNKILAAIRNALKTHKLTVVEVQKVFRLRPAIAKWALELAQK